MKQNEACQILAQLGVYSMLLGDKVSFRGATPQRYIRRTSKGRQPGGYGRGLAKHFARKNLEAKELA